MEATIVLCSCTGTIDTHNKIEIFGCCPGPDLMMFLVNLTEAIKIELKDVTSIKRKKKMSYNVHDYTWFPQFNLKKLQVNYYDETVLNFTYRELYSTQFSSKDCWINMFLVLSFGYFCVQKIIHQAVINPVSQYSNFGNAFGLSWFSYTNLAI